MNVRLNYSVVIGAIGSYWLITCFIDSVLFYQSSIFFWRQFDYVDAEEQFLLFKKKDWNKIM